MGGEAAPFQQVGFPLLLPSWPIKGPTRLSTAAQCHKPKSPQMFASALSFCSWQDVNFHPFISTALSQLQGLLEELSASSQYWGQQHNFLPFGKEILALSQWALFRHSLQTFPPHPSCVPIPIPSCMLAVGSWCLSVHHYYYYTEKNGWKSRA